MAGLPSPERFREFLARNDVAAIREACRLAHPRDLARVIEQLKDGEVWAVLRRVEAPVDAEIFSHLDLERQAMLASGHNAREVALFLEHMAADDRADLLRRLPRFASRIGVVAGP
jgi:Mg/Co/Ni transporter MgtE